MLGVIGGMGPAATADFFVKLIAATSAQRDDEHIPVLIHSVPQIPSRPAAILEGGPSPLPKLIEARDRLIVAGATLLAMPCNTAHFWARDLMAGCVVPFVHIADATREELAPRVSAGDRVGIIATRATLAGDVYTPVFRALGVQMQIPTTAEYEARVAPAIAAVKAGDARVAGDLIGPVIDSLGALGAKAVILACTELPIAIAAVDFPRRELCVDPTAALARACVRAWRDPIS
jgi:aspartate racemase